MSSLSKCIIQSVLIMLPILISGCSSPPDKKFQGEKLALPTSAAIVAIHFNSGSEGYVVTESGEVFRTVDGGKSFLKLDVNATGTLAGVYFLTDDIGFVFGKSGYLARTGDAGKSWNGITIDSTYDLRDMAFLDKEHGFLIGAINSPEHKDEGFIGTSSDKGLSWKFDSTQFKGFEYIGLVRGNHLWIIGSDAMIYTIDKGQTWEHNVSRGHDTVRALSFSDIAHGWSVGDNGLLRYSSDGGWSWKDMPKLTGRNLTCIAAPEIDATYLAGDRFVAITTDHGRTWMADSLNYPIRFTRCQSVGSEVFFAGSAGTILKFKR